MMGKKCICSLFLVAAILLTTVYQMPVCVRAKGNTKKTKYYTISKQAGTYTAAIKVKLKAKRGYKVFYKTSGGFKKSKVIKGGKSKSFKIKKTTVLSLCAVKKSVKVTNRKLNKIFRQKKKAYYAKYKYTIARSTATKIPTSTVNPVETTSVPVGTPSVSSVPGGTIQPEGTPPAGEMPPSGSLTPENPPSSGTVTADPEGKSAAQEKLNEAESLLTAGVDKPLIKTPSVMENDTPVITLQEDGMTADHLEAHAAVYAEVGNLNTLTINQAGTYVLTGGTAWKPVTNTEIIVADNISGEVSLIWENLFIDNHTLGKNDGEDVPVFYVGKSTSDVHVTLKGSSVLTGNGACTESPAAAIICADDAGTTLSFSAYEGDNTASLTLVDAMDADTDFGENTPSDGIYCKGMLVFHSGTYSISVNGDCLKGTGKKGKGGIWINDGKYTLHSAHSNALKSKNGNIVIQDGAIQSTYTAGDSIQAKNYSVIITGGAIEIDQCYGDGIQGEYVYISGDDTSIHIKTYYENAGMNYYNSALGSGNYNTISGTNTSKKEVVNVDTGSHKGIKGGTKSCTYSYQSVDSGSDYVAGTVIQRRLLGEFLYPGET